MPKVRWVVFYSKFHRLSSGAKNFKNRLRFDKVATLPWEIKNANCLQIFSIYGKCKQIAFLSPCLFTHPQISMFSGFKIVSFPILIANKILHVTVFLLVYFCDQFAATKIRNSRCHSSVRKQSTWYSATRTKF